MKNRKGIYYIGENKDYRDKMVAFFDYYEDYNSITLYMNYSESEINYIFNNSVIKDLMKIGIKKGRYLSIGLFPNQNDEELFIKKNLSVSHINDHGYQKFLYIKIEDSVIDFLEKASMDDSGKIRWFSYRFCDDVKGNSSIIDIEHCGEECHLKLGKYFSYDDFLKILFDNDLELGKFVL
jgi:hypothetical protein